MSNPDPSIDDRQKPTQAFDKLVEALQSPSSAQKQQQVIAIQKANPLLTTAIKKQKTAQEQQQQTLLQQEQDQKMFQQEQEQKHQQQQLIQQEQKQQQQRQMLLNKCNMVENQTISSQQILQNPDPSIAGMQRSTQAVQKLVEALISSSAQQQQVLAILKADPQLMIPLKKQKTTQDEQQQQQLLQQDKQQQKLIQQEEQQKQRQMLLSEGLKTPSTQQPQQVLAILKVNPPSLINHGATQQQQQQMLPNECNMTGNPRKPHQVLPNPNLSIAAMQRPTQACMWFLETLETPPPAQQPQEVLASLKANPQLKANFKNRRTWQQQKKLLQEQQMLLNEGDLTGSPIMRPRQVLPNPDLSIAGMQKPTQAWKQLLVTLKSPVSARQQLLDIMKANPELIHSFRKHRTALTQQHQQTQMLPKEGTRNTETDHELFLNLRNRDVTIEARRRKFNCHKCILGASPLFYAKNEHDIERKDSGIVTIEDSEPTTFQNFLLYLYTGSKNHLSMKNVMDRYKLANKYCVGDLERLWPEYIEKNITIENFYDFFLLSQMHNDQELIDITIEFFLKNSKKITESEKWAVFVTENPVESNELIKALDCNYTV